MLRDKDDFEKDTSSIPEDIGAHWNTPYMSAWHGLPAGQCGPTVARNYPFLPLSRKASPAK